MLLESLLASVDPPPGVSGDFDPEKFLTEFKQACEIDLRLRPATIVERIRHVRWLLRFLDKHPLRATRQELRQFLALNPAQNAVKALHVLYGRFLGSDLASCFRVSQSLPHVIIVPTREQLLQTYENLKTLELRAAFLIFAASGLRRHELMELAPAQINLDKRMIMPSDDPSSTKFQWVTFFNDEAKTVLQELLYTKSPSPDERIFRMYKDTLTRKLRQISTTSSGFKITPQVLRNWFCNEMGRLGVQDRYIDAFCGRIPKSVLARHYTDYSPERLKEVYDKANLWVFDHARVEPTQTTLLVKRAEAAEA